MAFFPRASITKTLLNSARCLIPLALLYALLLGTSWTPESFSLLLPGDFQAGVRGMLNGTPSLQFIPTIGGVSKLLSAPIASVSAWAHLQFIAFFCARWIWMDGGPTHSTPAHKTPSHECHVGDLFLRRNVVEFPRLLLCILTMLRLLLQLQLGTGTCSPPCACAGLVKQVVTAHSVVLCAILPPLGFLSHIFTCFFLRSYSSKGNPPDADAVWPTSAGSTSSGSGAGRIRLLISTIPYDQSQHISAWWVGPQ
jgi:hypothetical protein